MGEETSASWHSMSEDNIFSDHKVTLVLIKVKVCFLAIAKDWEIIHECSQFGQRKSPFYTYEVKLVRCKDQQHSPVGECAVGIGEGSLTWSYELGDDKSIRQGIGRMSA